MFTDWGGRKVSEYWGNVFRCGKSGFTVNRGAVNRGFTVIPILTIFILLAQRNINTVLYSYGKGIGPSF